MKQFIGVDVGKLSLYIYDAKTSTDVKIKNDLTEIKKYFNKYKTKKEVTVVLEPTGIYFQKLMKVLNDLVIDYFLIPLDVIHNLNKILGEDNKNDTIDARKIANYGALIKEHEEKGSYKIRAVKKQIKYPAQNAQHTSQSNTRESVSPLKYRGWKNGSNNPHKAVIAITWKANAIGPLFSLFLAVAIRRLCREDVLLAKK